MEDKEENPTVSDQALMNKTLDEDERKSLQVIELYEIFFEDFTLHQFTEERLYWLAKWIGTENVMQKIVFLKNLWCKDSFHPFLGPDQTSEMIASQMDKGNNNRFTISLSSSVPDMIRITFASTRRKGIVHRRLDVSNTNPNVINDGFMLKTPINYNTFVLFEEIEKLLIHHNPQLFRVFRPIKYVSFEQIDKNLEPPLPYSDM